MHYLESIDYCYMLKSKTEWFMEIQMYCEKNICLNFLNLLKSLR